MTLLLNVNTGEEADIFWFIHRRYAGKNWKEWCNIERKLLLEEPFNLRLKLKFDWMQPYDRTNLSIGIIT